MSIFVLDALRQFQSRRMALELGRPAAALFTVIAVEADRRGNGQQFVTFSSGELRDFAGYRGDKQVFAGLNALQRAGWLERESRKGRCGRYRVIIPARDVDPAPDSGSGSDAADLGTGEPTGKKEVGSGAGSGRPAPNPRRKAPPTLPREPTVRTTVTHEFHPNPTLKPHDHGVERKEYGNGSRRQTFSGGPRYGNWSGGGIDASEFEDETYGSLRGRFGEWVERRGGRDTPDAQRRFFGWWIYVARHLRAERNTVRKPGAYFQSVLDGPNMPPDCDVEAANALIVPAGEVPAETHRLLASVGNGGQGRHKIDATELANPPANAAPGSSPAPVTRSAEGNDSQSGVRVQGDATPEPQKGDGEGGQAVRRLAPPGRSSAPLEPRNKDAETQRAELRKRFSGTGLR